MAWMRFRKKDMPGGLWTKCPSCEEMIFGKDLEAGFKICPKCSYLFPLSVAERIHYTLDPDSFEERDADMATVDALQFKDDAPYSEKLARTQQKTGRNEAMVYGTGMLRGRPLVFGALEFAFLGGSMGVVVGEKVARAAELARERKLPLLLVSSSGGARMHEGALSLMQMAKTCAALARFHETRGLYVSLLAHPTTGGVTASFATMADVILAEPGALIGFAGPRVIKNTIRQDLPKGFQTAEFLLKKGQLDRIVQRQHLVDELDRIFYYLLGPLPDRPRSPRPRTGAETEQKVARTVAAGAGSEGVEGEKKKKGAGRAARDVRPNGAAESGPTPDLPEGKAAGKGRA